MVHYLVPPVDLPEQPLTGLAVFDEPPAALRRLTVLQLVAVFAVAGLSVGLAGMKTAWIANVIARVVVDVMALVAQMAAQMG